MRGIAGQVMLAIVGVWIGLVGVLAVIEVLPQQLRLLAFVVLTVGAIWFVFALVLAFLTEGRHGVYEALEALGLRRTRVPNPLEPRDAGNSE